MQTTKEEIQYPQNLDLRKQIVDKGINFSFISRKLGVSRVYLSRVLNGHDKGGQIMDQLKQIAEGN